MLAALLRGLIGGAAARGAMGGGAGGLLKSFMGGGGKKGADGGGNQPGPGAAATKPAVNYGQMMANMGNKYAYQDQEIEQRKADYQQRQQAQQGGQGQAQLQEMAANAGEAAKSLGGVIASTTGLSDGVDAVSKAMSGDLLGAIKSAATMNLKLAAAIVTLPMAIKAWSESLLESRREMAKYDGRSVAAFARLDVRKTMLDIGSSQARGESTASLADAVGDLRDELRPIEDGLANITNWVGVGVTRVAQGIAWLAKFHPLIALIADNTKKDTSTSDLPIKMLIDRITDPANNQAKFRGWDHNDNRGPLPPLR